MNRFLFIFECTIMKSFIYFQIAFQLGNKRFKFAYTVVCSYQYYVEETFSPPKKWQRPSSHLPMFIQFNSIEFNYMLIEMNFIWNISKKIIKPYKKSSVPVSE